MYFYLFGLCLLISIGVIVYMISKNFVNIDAYYWSIVLIIPVILLGYTMKTRVASVGEAKLAFCFIYLDSTIMLALVLFSLMKDLHMHVNKWVTMVTYLICFLHLGSIWVCKDNDLYYASMQIIDTPLGTITKMTDGPLKVTHYIYLAIMFIWIMGMVAYAYFCKKDCSKRVIYTYGTISLSCIVMYIIEMFSGLDFSILPFLYVAGDIVIAVGYENAHSHDLECVVVEQRRDNFKRGFVAFNKKKELLCYNEDATRFVPQLQGKRIDEAFHEEDKRLQEVFYPLIDQFEAGGDSTADFTLDDLIFRCSVTYFHMHKGGKSNGYLVEIQDITAEQGYMNLIKEYGQSLKREVEYQTNHIREIQQSVVLSMATIIENRDMNTGGHVKRTSDIIKILVDEMRLQGVGDLDERYADQIIRSAPMHDLGKISIDNSILCKPGRLTDEEFAIMKTHSAKSGEIVKAILSSVEEPEFVQTAFCLARFHHERWDGKGYPERLAQFEIPLEARIMAVADVYDALVSKRCYKEAMSFSDAAKIMVEGMGTQFDPMMLPIFEACRTRLEDYYKENNRE